MHPRSLTILPMAFLCAAIALPAQTSTPPADSGVVLKTSARAVAVDVVVMRSNDDPVTALQKNDFQIFEDGKPQSIDYFEEHTVKDLPPAALKPLPPMPPGVYTNVPAVPPADDVNVILLDTLNSEGQDLSYGRAQVLKFLSTMKPGTRAAIFMLGDRLNFVQGFTADNSLLAAAINNKQNQVAPTKSGQFYSSTDAADDAESLSILTAMMGGFATGAGTTGVAEMGAAQSKSASFQYARRVSMTLEALSYLARYLGNVPGRKNLLWFAGNFPVNIFPSAQQRESLNDARVYASQIRNTADLLTTGKVAVYPINIQGMMNDHMLDANSAGPGGMGGMGAYAGEASARADTIFTMNELAADTGGHAFYNTNDLATAANRAISEGSHYYTLVYTPRNKNMDGKFRKITVKLAAGHYQLSYRRGYNADDPATLAATGSTSFLSLGSTGDKAATPAVSDDPLRPLLMRGLPSASQLLYAVRVVPANPQPAPDAKIAGKNSALTGSVTRYTVDFFIRWTDVVFNPGDPKTQPDAHVAKIQLGLMAYDRSGKALNWLGATQQMQLDPKIFVAVQKSGIPAHMEIDVPSNTDVFLETGVYDWGSNKAGTLEIPIHPAAAQTSATSPATSPQSAPKTN